MRERKGGRVRHQQNVEQMLRKRSSESGDQQLHAEGKNLFVGKQHAKTMKTKRSEGRTIGVSVFNAGTPD